MQYQGRCYMLSIPVQLPVVLEIHADSDIFSESKENISQWIKADSRVSWIFTVKEESKIRQNYIAKFYKCEELHQRLKVLINISINPASHMSMKDHQKPAHRTFMPCHIQGEPVTGCINRKIRNTSSLLFHNELMVTEQQFLSS